MDFRLNFLSILLEKSMKIVVVSCKGNSTGKLCFSTSQAYDLFKTFLHVLMLFKSVRLRFSIQISFERNQT